MTPSRDQIRASNDTKLSPPIAVPEWGEGAVVHVKTISGDELSEWENEISLRRGPDKKLKDSKGIKAALLVRSCCDGEGNCVFEKSDAAWLGAKSGAVLGRLWDAASEINGLGDESQKKLEKNYEPTPMNDSGSS